MKWLLLLLFSSSAFATPDKVEFIFLSEKKTTSLMKYLDHKDKPQTYQSLAQRFDTDCVPMGEGCFHPQYGIMPDGKEPPVKVKKTREYAEFNDVKTINNPDIDLINCEKGNYFDIFCGKAKGSKRAASIEVWIDTSSSMRRMDYSREDNYCSRKTFVAKVQKACGKKADFSIFDTGKKELGDLSSLCINKGLNDGARMVDWIKNSNIRYLLVITDLEEYKGPLREFIEVEGMKTFGLGVKGFDSDALIKFSKNLEKVCRSH